MNLNGPFDNWWTKDHPDAAKEFKAQFGREPATDKEFLNFMCDREEKANQEKRLKEIDCFKKVICALCSHNTVCRLMATYAEGKEDFSCTSFSVNSNHPEIIDTDTLNMYGYPMGYVCQNPAQLGGGYFQPQESKNPNFRRSFAPGNNIYVSLKFLRLFDLKRTSAKSDTSSKTSTK